MIFRFINKHKLILILVLILVVKITLLPFTAHPFDFQSFTRTVDRYFLYNWNIFDWFNKGSPLIFMWASVHSLYLLIITSTSKHDNILLLLFLYKLPSVFFDFLIGYLIYILAKLHTNINDARKLFLIWLLNPMIFYIYGIHGHYEIIVPLSLMLVTWGLVKKNIYIVSIGLAIGISVKYFPILIIPYILLYLLQFKNRISNLLKLLFVTTGLLVIFFSHLVIYENLFRETYESVQTLSGAHTLKGETTLDKIDYISSNNIFSAINYIATEQPLIRSNNANLIDIAHRWYVYAILAQIIVLLRRLFLNFKIKKKYNIEYFIEDILLSITSFLIFSTNFQLHYICWLLPFQILYIIWDKRMLSIITTITVIVYIIMLKNELGFNTFLIPTIKIGENLFFNVVNQHIFYLMGSILILMYVFSIFLIFSPPIKQQRFEHFKLPYIITVLLLNFYTVFLFANVVKSVRDEYNSITNKIPKMLDYEIVTNEEINNVKNFDKYLAIEESTLLLSSENDNINCFFKQKKDNKLKTYLKDIPECQQNNLNVSKEDSIYSSRPRQEVMDSLNMNEYLWLSFFGLLFVSSPLFCIFIIYSVNKEKRDGQ